MARTQTPKRSAPPAKTAPSKASEPVTDADAPPSVDVAAAPDAPAKKPTGAGAQAQRVLDANDPAAVAALVAQLTDDKESVSTQAARVLEEIATLKADVLAPHVPAFVQALSSSQARVVACAAEVLPVLGRVAPAKLAKHLDALTQAYPQLSAVGKDGLVRGLTALCLASVAYQKRLEPIFGRALGDADAKTLQRWSDLVLPALKGEPHAAARAVVEKRLYDIPRDAAQKLAASLGIKLRPVMR